MQASLEPASHYFYSDRLKLQFWDWGTEGKPVLILVHGTRDHARSWDWIARALRDDYHVYALDLRGHGNIWEVVLTSRIAQNRKPMRSKKRTSRTT